MWRAKVRRRRCRAAALAALAVVAAGFGAFDVPSALADTTVSVTTKSDESVPGDGTCSLREAIAYANAINGRDHDCGGTPSGTTTIKVPASSSHYLLGAQLEITSGGPGPVVIDGGGTGALGTTIDAAGNDRVLQVDGAHVILNALTVENGRPRVADEPGGGILNFGTLRLVRVAVIGNATDTPPSGSGLGAADGGGIFNGNLSGSPPRC